MESRSPDVAAYEKILAEHQEIKALLGRIEQTLSERQTTLDQVAAMLAELGDRLVKHFAIEEEGDYFTELMHRAPQLVVRANELMAQHPRMCSRARQLVTELSAMTPSEDWWQQTKQRFDAFKAELVKHESGENRLLQDAYTQDIGTHD